MTLQALQTPSHRVCDQEGDSEWACGRDGAGEKGCPVTPAWLLLPALPWWYTPWCWKSESQVWPCGWDHCLHSVLRECRLRVYTETRALLSGYFGSRGQSHSVAASRREFAAAKWDRGRGLAAVSCTAASAWTGSCRALSTLVPVEPNIRSVPDTTQRGARCSHTPLSGNNVGRPHQKRGLQVLITLQSGNWKLSGKFSFEFRF